MPTGSPRSFGSIRDRFPTGSGQVLANIALLRRPPDMSREDYLDYWMLHHTAVAIRTQNTEAYVQNIVEEVLTDGSPEVAGSSKNTSRWLR